MPVTAAGQVNCSARALAWARLPLQLVMAWAALQARPEPD